MSPNTNNTPLSLTMENEQKPEVSIKPNRSARREKLRKKKLRRKRF